VPTPGGRVLVRAAAMSAEAAPGVAPAEEARGAAVLAEMVEEAAVWCAVHGLVVGDRADPVRRRHPPLPPRSKGCSPKRGAALVLRRGEARIFGPGLPNPSNLPPALG